MISLNYLDPDGLLVSQGDQTELECTIAYLEKTCNSPGNAEFTGRRIDHKLLLYPYCIVFIPFPILSWMIPVLGHYGIGMSDGTVRDFSHNYEIGVNTISFGTPTKYCRLSPSLTGDNGVLGWDWAIGVATNDYLKQRGQPVSHSKKKNPSYVAESLNYMKYNNKDDWSRCSVFLMMLRYGRYTNCGGFLRTWLPFFLLVTLCTFLICIINTFSEKK